MPTSRPKQSTRPNFLASTANWRSLCARSRITIPSILNNRLKEALTEKDNVRDELEYSGYFYASARGSERERIDLARR